MGLLALRLLGIRSLDLVSLGPAAEFTSCLSPTERASRAGHWVLGAFSLPSPGQLYLPRLGEAADGFPFAQVWSGVLLPWYLPGQAKGLHQ